MSNNDDYRGYRAKGLEALKRFGAKVWDDVEIETNKGAFAGLILPRSTTEDSDHLVLKLSSGYNVGLRIENISNMKVLGRKEGNYQIPEKAFPFDKKKPNVTLLGTGGTIASRLDYTTGAVIPAFSPGELYGAVPELADICNLNTKNCSVFFLKIWVRSNTKPWLKKLERKSKKALRELL